MTGKITVIGGGLAGTEAAWQIAQLGIDVELYEMRPHQMTGAHKGSGLAEVVCSNSLGSMLDDRATGVLRSEIERLGSLLIECAKESSVPAGAALAVDREIFSQKVEEKLTAHPRITIKREEMKSIPESGTVVVASGPLTSHDLCESIQNKTKSEGLFFFDAISPIVEESSINYEIAFRASRYDKGETQEGDYINCPFNEDEYKAFYDELIKAEVIALKGFEKDILTGVKSGAHKFFESCLPIEVIARRGFKALSFGPMRPVGLKDPRTGRRPYAVLQLRQDNLKGSLYNMVGFQTNIKYPEQERIFRMIPGLEKAEFVRFGEMHRNTFISSPELLSPSLNLREEPRVFFAGQLTGVEGYMGNIATGLLAGINAARLYKNEDLLVLPEETVLGSLCHYVTHADLKDFQPMKANFGILPSLFPAIKGKRERAKGYRDRSKMALDVYLASLDLS